MSNLAKSTKTQLIADYPNLNLKMSMTKDEMLSKIEESSPKEKPARQGRGGEY